MEVIYNFSCTTKLLEVLSRLPIHYCHIIKTKTSLTDSLWDTELKSGLHFSLKTQLTQKERE